ncbi:MAG: response regulator [Geminicoccaceae bacterium]|nr:response regulator [Geminicoccaceae bacterium]MCB9944078.1 response regulator [Geminicoccaceae bacterium]
MSDNPHILIVDDHREIRDLVGKYLGQHGFRTTTASGGEEARKLLRTGSFELVVLDIMMPGEDGLSLCRHLREATDIPVILLTAMAEETDRIVGLEIGADDYITKPFNPRELLARIKSVLRRTHALPPQREKLPDGVLRFERWKLDTAQRELIDENGVAVALSSADYRLLRAFIDHPGMVLTRDQLLDLTSGREARVFDRSIDNQVSRLRRKIEADPKQPTIIKTHWGGGYSFVAPVEKV